MIQRQQLGKHYYNVKKRLEYIMFQPLPNYFLYIILGFVMDFNHSLIDVLFTQIASSGGTISLLAASIAFIRREADNLAYISVVWILEWPKKSRITIRSVPFSTIAIAVECLILWGLQSFGMRDEFTVLALFAYFVSKRLNPVYISDNQNLTISMVMI